MFFSRKEKAFWVLEFDKNNFWGHMFNVNLRKNFESRLMYHAEKLIPICLFKFAKKWTTVLMCAVQLRARILNITVSFLPLVSFFTFFCLLVNSVESFVCAMPCLPNMASMINFLCLNLIPILSLKYETTFF